MDNLSETWVFETRVRPKFRGEIINDNQSQPILTTINW